MSSLQRSRSLRKPAPISTAPSAQDAKVERPAGSPSRLPQVKPLQRTASTTAGTGGPTVLRSGRTVSTALERTSSLRSSKLAAETTRKETARYPPSTTTTRTTPATRPTSSGSAAPPPRRTATHTRAKSTTTALKPSTILRPPSQTKTTTSTIGTRPTHTRTRSVDHAPAPAPAPKKTPPQPTVQAAQPRLRPAFSTLQQHYSPAKTHAPKPLTSTFLAPPSPSKLPANVAASAETSKLQAELLQLHLLDRDAAAVQAEWHASARDKLGKRFAALASASSDISDHERVLEESENILALRSWGRDGDLDEKIQLLDGVTKGLWALSEPGGRYARMARRFERWANKVSEIEESRTSGGVESHGDEGTFIGDLDASWKDDWPGLVRKLDGWHRELGVLSRTCDGEAQDSTVARMIDGLRTLARDMLAELHVMEDIEREALAKEDAWIERVINEEDGADAPRAGAIWRVL